MTSRKHQRFLALWILTTGMAFLTAQESEPPPELSSSPAPAEEGRILGVIPNYRTVPLTVSANEPLTRRGKFNLAFKDSVDPFTVAAAGLYSGVAQWQNDFPAFGQGVQGYAKRFGAAYADQATGNFLAEAILPSLLHQDPRYFRKGQGSKRGRLRYALTRTVITRTDSGKSTFNYSEIGGNAAAAGISTLYYPAAERTPAEASERLAVQLVSDSAFNVLIEFWPEMRHAIFKK